MKKIAIRLFLVIMLWGCASHSRYGDLQKSLHEFVADKDADIGVAVIINGTDTVEVNGNKPYPMLSVYKFPIALALADFYRLDSLTFEHPMNILPEDLHPDTYSPMTEKILASSLMSSDTLRLPTRELLRYMLQMSDNNASDIVLKASGGPYSVSAHLEKHGIEGVHVKSSEDEMHTDNSLCYENSATPLALAALMDKFDREFQDSLSIEIKQMMETCATGTERLAKPLIGGKEVIGHKTGTGFTLPDGRLMAVNDAGYVHLQDGRRYAIAVFVGNSGYDISGTEALIAEISKLVHEAILRQE